MCEKMTDDEYNKKLEDLQEFIPFLNSVIDQLKESQSKQREPQLTKMLSLHSMITNRKKKLKMKTLLKCEEVILKLYDRSKFCTKNLSPSTNSTTKQISDSKSPDCSDYSEDKKSDVFNIENLKKKAELLKASQDLPVRSFKPVSFSLTKPVKKLAPGPQLEAFQDDHSEEKLPKQGKPVLSLSSIDNRISESSKDKERRNSERKSESSSLKKTDRESSTEHRHKERKDKTKHNHTERKDEKRDNKHDGTTDKTARKVKDYLKHESKKQEKDKPADNYNPKPRKPTPPSTSSLNTTKEIVPNNITLSPHIVPPPPPSISPLNSTKEITTLSQHIGAPPILNFVKTQPSSILSVTSTRETNDITLTHPIFDYVQPPLSTKETTTNHITYSGPTFDFIQPQVPPLNYPQIQARPPQHIKTPPINSVNGVSEQPKKRKRRPRKRKRAKALEERERQLLISSTLDSSSEPQKKSKNKKKKPNQSKDRASFSSKSQIKKPKPSTSTAKVSEDLVSSSVTSSSECCCKKTEAVAVGEISSTNDVQEDQSEVTRFFTELLKNVRTRAITSKFIKQISKLTTDEKIKMVVHKARPVVRRRKAKLQAQLKRLKREKLAEFRRQLEKKKEEVTVEEKMKKKKAKPPSELDKLHKDINDMFIRDGVLTASGLRNCRLSKTPPVPNKLDPKSFSPEELKEMANVRVLLPKISIDKFNKPSTKRPKTWSDVPKAKRTKSTDEKQVEVPDKNYFSSNSRRYKLACKLCPFFGNNITNHYRSKHPESEVLSSRLRPDKAESAIKHSLELGLDDQEDAIVTMRRDHALKCRFCDVEITTRLSRCYDHVTTHTGEYRHLCSLCAFSVSTHTALKKHCLNVHKKVESSKAPRIMTRIYGYICLECNFVQMNKAAVEKHVKVYHAGARIVKIHLSENDDLVTNEGDLETRSSTDNEERTSPPEEQNEEKSEELLATLAPVDEETRSSTDNEMVIDEDQNEERRGTSESPPNEEKSEEPLSTMVPVDEETRSSTDNEMVIDEERRGTSESPHNEENSEELLATLAPVDEETRSSTDEMVIDEEQNEERRGTSESPPNEEKSEEPLTKRIKTEEDLDNLVVDELPPKQIKTEEPPTNEESELPSDETMSSLTSPPPLLPLIQKPQNYDSSTIRAGFLNIYKHPDGVKYECRVPSCLFATKLRDRFATHWDEDHSRFNGCYRMAICRVCQVEVTSTLDSPLLSEFFAHVVSKHLEQEPSAPALRIRRLSGDKLSKKEEENDLGIQISEVVSLAEEKRDEVKTTGEEPQTPAVMERVVLKESKLSKIEKETKWKSNEAMKMFLQCPKALYKCPQFFCKFSTSLKAVFDHHVTTHVPSKEHLVCCVYCDVKTPLNQASLHIDLRHSNCLYSCSLCLYRALNPQYVMVHMKTHHRADDGTILALPAKPSLSSKLKKFAVKKVCPPYKCGYKSCGAQFLFIDEYYNHITLNHGGFMICGYEKKEEGVYKYVTIDSLIEHYKVHHCYPFHCLLCKKGTTDLDTMLKHYSVRHPNVTPVVVDRSKGPEEEHNYYEDQAVEKIRYVTVDEILSFADGDKYTIVPAKDSIETPETSKKIVPSPKTSKKIVPSPKTSKKIVPSPETSKKTKPSPETRNKVTAIIPEVEPLSLETDDSGIERLGLSGSELFRCAFCTETLANETAFKQHYRSKNCRDPNDESRPFKCVHCGGKFKSLTGLNLHLQYHGQVRFQCAICNKRYPWLYQLKLHMKYHHDVKNMKTIPLVPNKTDLDKDEFAVAPIENIAEHAFHPYQVDDLPKEAVFRWPLKCALCLYSSKIRSDLIRHLQLHSSEMTEITPMFLICLDKNAWQN